VTTTPTEKPCRVSNFSPSFRTASKISAHEDSCAVSLGSGNENWYEVRRFHPNFSGWNHRSSSERAETFFGCQELKGKKENRPWPQNRRKISLQRNRRAWR